MSKTQPVCCGSSFSSAHHAVRFGFFQITSAKPFQNVALRQPKAMEQLNSPQKIELRNKDGDYLHIVRSFNGICKTRSALLWAKLMRGHWHVPAVLELCRTRLPLRPRAQSDRLLEPFSKQKRSLDYATTVSACIQ